VALPRKSGAECASESRPIGLAVGGQGKCRASRRRGSSVAGDFSGKFDLGRRRQRRTDPATYLIDRPPPWTHSQKSPASIEVDQEPVRIAFEDRPLREVRGRRI